MDDLGPPDGSVGKNLPASAGDSGFIPGLGRSSGGGHATHSSILAEKSHGQRNLEGYSPWSRKIVEHSLATKQQ